MRLDEPGQGGRAASDNSGKLAGQYARKFGKLID